MADISEVYSLGLLSNSGEKVSSFAAQLKVSKWAQSWIMVEGKTYLVKAELFDKDANSILLTNNLEFASHFDKKYLQLLESNSIRSEYIVKVVTHQHSEPLPAHKTVISASLSQIKTKQLKKYVVDSNKIKDEKEITITSPVKIVHPTPSVLLPYLKSKGGKFIPEMWHMKALGGSGSYNWKTSDPSVAKTGEMAVVRSAGVGITTLRVSDVNNEFNYATIEVEVAPVHHLSWLEHRLEVQAQTQTGVLSAIAVDSRGRKFTNCTAIPLRYELKGESAKITGANHTSWK